MRKYLWTIAGACLLCLTIVVPYWPAVLFYGLFFWAACPHYNVLSPACGEITTAFVLLRLAQAAFLGALAYVLWRLVKRKN